MRDGIDTLEILACEQVSQGLLVTFQDRKTFIFKYEVLFAHRESMGRQVTFAPEEDEDHPATA
jgi:hypothetical protein